MKLMSAIGIPIKVATIGFTVILMFGGCSSRQHTAVMSAEETQPQQEAKPSDEMVQTSELPHEPVSPEMGTSIPEDNLSRGSAGSVVEESPQEFIPPETAEESLVSPLGTPTESSPTPLVEEMPETGPEEMSAIGSEAADLAENIPPVEGEAELLPDPGFTLPVTPTDPLPDPESSEAPEMAQLSPDTSEGQLAAVSSIPSTITDIFFDFDQFTIRRDEITTLEGNAKFLLEKYAGQKILIEGHCDERGTEEYNIVLGKRRAQAVKDYLVDLGIPEENLQVISFGKEKPFCTEHNQTCWQQNRRGHFVLK